MSLARPPARLRGSIVGSIARLLVILVFVGLIALLGWAVSVRGSIAAAETVDRDVVAPGRVVVLPGLTEVHLQTLGGAGPAVLLIHDFDVAGGSQWRPLAGSLGTHRLLVPDMVDFGYSARPAQPGRIHTVIGQAETLLALLEEIEVSRVAVVGAGMGGAVAAQMAVLAPEVVDRLALIAPEITGPPPTWSSLLYRFPILGEAMTFTFIGAGSQADARYASGCQTGGYCPDAEAMAARAAAARVAGTARALYSRFQTPPAATLPDDLSTITAPTLVVWGDADPVLPVAEGEALAGSIPGAAILIVPGAGHRPHLEDPATTAALLADFLGR